MGNLFFCYKVVSASQTIRCCLRQHSLHPRCEHRGITPCNKRHEDKKQRYGIQNHGRPNSCIQHGIVRAPPGSAHSEVGRRAQGHGVCLYLLSYKLFLDKRLDMIDKKVFRYLDLIKDIPDLNEFLRPIDKSGNWTKKYVMFKHYVKRN